ncbi:hypothetical protein GCM10017653_47000 [Ancylobacter defluvii]|uniref:Uncharacterized protein n=1 Tax=Ancylobacter defluvii TaxID=1282440 RepID=A0A9W6K2P0_9HYPH|nr:hypothetical protein GCM10017653_47000 [Ancylobacter defluvii]
MSARLSCCVPFCRKTRRSEDEDAEWLCAPHYRLASAAARTEYDEAWKRAEAEDKRTDAGD